MYQLQNDHFSQSRSPLQIGIQHLFRLVGRFWSITVEFYWSLEICDGSVVLEDGRGVELVVSGSTSSLKINNITNVRELRRFGLSILTS